MIVAGGAHGVAVFFVISGYLITTLLLREFRKTGSLSLGRFYFRRTLRIFPPFYIYLAVMAIVWYLGIIPELLSSFLAAASYTWSLDPNASGYYLTHSWSLSIEELFYLFWPLAFLWAHRSKKVIQLSFGLILGMPFLRVASYFVFPSLRGHEGYMVQGWIDTMMVGCLLALLKDRAGWQRWHARYVNGWTAGAMAFTGFFVVPWVQTSLPRKLGSLFYLSTSFTITALCIGGVLIYLVEHPNTWAGRFMNNAILRHVGVLSYSLYLWQQPFLHQDLHLVPYGYLYTFAAAEISFWLIEKPSFRVREYLEQRWAKRASRPAFGLGENH